MTFINTISQDGRITTQELLAFFAEKGTIDDAARNARYWLEKIDGYGDTSGFITLVCMRRSLGNNMVRVHVVASELSLRARIYSHPFPSINTWQHVYVGMHLLPKSLSTMTTNVPHCPPSRVLTGRDAK